MVGAPTVCSAAGILAQSSASDAGQRGLLRKTGRLPYAYKRLLPTSLNSYGSISKC